LSGTRATVPPWFASAFRVRGRGPRLLSLSQSSSEYCDAHCSKNEPLISQLGQKRTFTAVCAVSDLPPKADVIRTAIVPACAKSGVMQFCLITNRPRVCVLLK